MENGYALCLNKWALDQDIKNELGLLVIISSLCAEKGYCFASNEYLAKIFKTHEKTISRKIKKLESKKYIKINYKKKGFEIISREIRVTKMLPVHQQNCYPSSNKNVTYKNISTNNTSINNKRIIEYINEMNDYRWFDEKS